MKTQSTNSKSPKRVSAPKRKGSLEAASKAAPGLIGEDLLSLRTEADRPIGLLAAIVDSSDDAIISKNLDGIVTSWNKGAERIFGYSAQEAIGQHITLIIPVDGRSEEAEILDRIKRGNRIENTSSSLFTVAALSTRPLAETSLTWTRLTIAKTVTGPITKAHGEFHLPMDCMRAM